MKEAKLYGIAAEFDDPEPLLDAVRMLHEHGFRRMETYTPYPIKQIDEYIQHRGNLPLRVLIGGVCGTATAWLMQFYIAAYDYPTNIGGRPLNSWPSFIVIMFELTILFAGLTTFFGMAAMCGFPLPHHPVFNTRNFEGASNNRFFVCVEAADPLFNASTVKSLLDQMDPVEVSEVADD